MIYKIKFSNKLFIAICCLFFSFISQSQEEITLSKYLFINRVKSNVIGSGYKDQIYKMAIQIVTRSKEYHIMLSPNQSFENSKLPLYKLDFIITSSINEFEIGLGEKKYNLEFRISKAKNNKPIKKITKENVLERKLLLESRYGLNELILGDSRIKRKKRKKKKKTVSIAEEDELEEGEDKSYSSSVHSISRPHEFSRDVEPGKIQLTTIPSETIISVIKSLTPDPFDQVSKISKPAEIKKRVVGRVAPGKYSLKLEKEIDTSVSTMPPLGKHYRISLNYLTDSIYSIDQIETTTNLTFVGPEFSFIIGQDKRSPDGYQFKAMMAMPMKQDSEFEVPNFTSFSFSRLEAISLLRLYLVFGLALEKQYFINLNSIGQELALANNQILWAELGIRKPFKIISWPIELGIYIRSSFLAMSDNYSNETEMKLSANMISSKIMFGLFNNLHFAINYSYLTMGAQNFQKLDVKQTMISSGLLYNL